MQNLRPPLLRRFTSRFPSALITALLGPVVACHAINYTWNNAGTDWNTSSSWNPSSGSGIPNAGGDIAIFNTQSVTNPNISSSVSISRITANSASATGYTLTSSGGATLTLGSVGTTTSSAINYTPATGSFTVNAPIILGAAAGSTQTFHVASSGGTVQVNGAISNTNSITLQKSGNGSLVLASSGNSYSGGTLVSAGTLLLQGAGVLGGGNLTMNGGAFDISGISGSAYTHGAALVGSGTLRGGGKTLAVNGLAPAQTLSLDNITLSLSGTTIFDFSSASFGNGTFGLVQGASGSGVNFGGTLSLNFSGGGYTNGSSVQIFDVSTYSGDFGAVTFSGLGTGQAAIFDAATGYVTVVPEPSICAFVILGVCLLVPRLRSVRISSGSK